MLIMPIHTGPGCALKSTSIRTYFTGDLTRDQRQALFVAVVRENVHVLIALHHPHADGLPPSFPVLRFAAVADG